MIQLANEAPEGVHLLVGPVPVKDLYRELAERKVVAVTRDSLVLPDHYPLMEQNRNKVWADNLMSFLMFCEKGGITLILVGPDPRHDPPLWGCYGKKVSP